MSLEETIAETVRVTVRAELAFIKEELAALRRTQTAARSMPTPRGLLSLAEAATFLGVSTSTLRAYVRSKRVAFTRPGGKVYRFDVAELEAFAREGRGQDGLDFAEQSRANLRRAIGR